MKLLALLAAMILAASLGASPTRLMTLDNGHQLVPDDWDGAMNYALAPNFKDRVYFDVNQGQAMGWAFLDIHLGTLILWWNNPYEQGSLFKVLAQDGATLGLGLSQASLSGLSPLLPGELRLQVPANQVALGWAFELAESLNAALCFRWAEARGEDKRSYGSASGGVLGSMPASSATFMGGGGYSALKVATGENVQFQQGLIFSPQLAWRGERLALEAKGELGLNKVDNAHHETLLSAGARGQVDQTLRDGGELSWGFKPRLIYSLEKDGTLVLSGAWSRLQLGLEHRLRGTFTGAGLSAVELAGFEHVDSNLSTVAENYELWLGWLRPFKINRGQLVLGLGGTQQQRDSSSRKRAPINTAVSYNNLSLAQGNSLMEKEQHVALLLGAEGEVRPWCMARAMVQRDLWQSSVRDTSLQTMDTAGTLTLLDQHHESGWAASSWVLGLGLGFDLGALHWDLALQSEWLGSSTGTALSQPLARSTWSFAF